MSKFLNSVQTESMRAEIIAYNKHHMQSIDAAHAQLIELQEYHDATIKHEFEEVGESLRYNHSEIYLILPKDSKFKIRVKFGHATKNKWEFYIASENILKLKNLSHKERLDAENKFTKPKNVGTLSVKKVQDWVEYLTSVYEVMEEMNGENMTVVEKFREKIKDLPVKWYAHGKNERGYIDGNNGLRYIFNIETNHISERIEYVGSAKGQNLESFLEISGELVK